VTGWRRYIDKYLLLSWKRVLIIAGVWVLSVVLHKAMYGPFSDYFVPKDCLGSNHVSAILQDGDGNLWFATGWFIVGSGVSEGGGVSRYDGASWQTFTTNDGLAHNAARAILQDRDGNLWFGTRGGVSRYDGASWRIFTTKDGLADNDVSAILQDGDGNLWFGTDGGVSRYDGASWQTFTTNDGLGDNRVVCILQDRDGNLWFGTDGGVSRYDGASWQTFTRSNGWLGEVKCILQDRDGNLWFGTHAGLSRYDGASWQTFTDNDCLVAYLFCSILQDTDGNLWFGARCGASRYDGTSWQTFTTKDGLADNEIMSSLQDTDGNLWFGTGGGVSRYDGTSWQTFTTKIGLVPNAVFTLGAVLIPLYFVISLVYTVIRRMEHDQYLLLSWKTLLVIPASGLLAIVLYVVVFYLFYEHIILSGDDEGVGMLAFLVIPCFFIIALVYTVIRKVVKLLRNRTS
jgi:ligand-binding sensor domain-containing protein